MNNNSEAVGQGSQKRSSAEARKIASLGMKPVSEGAVWLEVMEEVVNAIHRVSDEEHSVFTRCVEPGTSFLADKLNLTSNQAMLLSLFVNRCDDSRIFLRELANDLGCSHIKMLIYKNDVDVLVDRQYVYRRQGSDGSTAESYSVPDEVVEALRLSKPYVPVVKDNLKLDELIAEFSRLFSLAKDGTLSHDVLEQKVKRLMELNNHLPFVKKISQALGDDIDDILLLLCFVILFVNNDDNRIMLSDWEFLCTSSLEANRISTALSAGCHNLMLSDLVEYSPDNGVVDTSVFKLTDSAKRNLLGELHLPHAADAMRINGLTSYRDISKKALYYPQNVSRNVDELACLLDQRNYKNVVKRMKQKNFRGGFACLFYGAPGTGKTETVNQLARLTGRDIMLVDIPSIRNCFVGETERNIKAVFDKYAALVKSSKKAPILLFNEADAIFGVRSENAEHSADKMENAMQNIILQEMEKLNGIMIATTNLTGNLDSAFERRFIYKIRFEKPDASVRYKIWHDMLPDFKSDDVLDVLSKRFELSGGQIENIARRYTIETILHGDLNDIEAKDQLVRLCLGERILGVNEGKKVGF